MKEYLQVNTPASWESLLSKTLATCRAQKKQCFVLNVATADWCGACKMVTPLLEHLPSLWKKAHAEQRFHSVAEVLFVWTDGTHHSRNKEVDAFLQASGVKAFPSIQLREITQDPGPLNIRSEQRHKLVSLSGFIGVESWLGHQKKVFAARQHPVQQHMVETLLYELRGKIRSSLLANQEQSLPSTRELKTLAQRAVLATDFLEWSKTKVNRDPSAKELEADLPANVRRLFQFDIAVLKAQLQRLVKEILKRDLAQGGALDTMFAAIHSTRDKQAKQKLLLALFEEAYRFAWRNA